jgi:hypothetical protein
MPAQRPLLNRGWRILLSGCTGGVLAALLAMFSSLDIIHACLLLATATGWIAAEYAEDSGKG